MNKQANYLLFDSVALATKIGISYKPKDRQQTLISQRYAIIVLFHSYLPKGSPKKIEIGLHEQYKAKRLQGEWFSLSFADIESIIRKLSPQGSVYQINFNALSYAKSLLDKDAYYHIAGDIVNHPFFIREERQWREKLKEVEVLRAQAKEELRQIKAMREEMEGEMRRELCEKYEQEWLTKLRECESNALMAKRIGEMAWRMLWDYAEAEENRKGSQ